jgi:hypothetical protein
MLTKYATLFAVLAALGLLPDPIRPRLHGMRKHPSRAVLYYWSCSRRKVVPVACLLTVFWRRSTRPSQSPERI